MFSHLNRRRWLLIGAFACLTTAACEAAPPDNPNAPTPQVASSAPEVGNAQLDALFEERQRQLGLSTGACDDATFLRRVSLDLAGTVPPVLPVRDFLADRDPQKREKLVETLLASDEFAEHWGRILAEMTTGLRPVRKDLNNGVPFDGRAFQRHLRNELAADRSYRDIVRGLIADDGAADNNAAVNFLLRYDVDPVQLTGAITKRFLGLSLECAQCHAHPFDHWTQDDFWGMAACFARSKRMFDPTGQFHAVIDVSRGELEIDAPPAAQAAAGEAEQSNVEGGSPAEQPPAEPTKRVVAPRLLNDVAVDADGSRRTALAEWVTSKENAEFARCAVNQVWSKIFSTSLLPNIPGADAKPDELSMKILETLSAQFDASGGSLDSLLRNIVLSRWYAAAAEVTSGASAETSASWHAGMRFRARPLSADELFRSIVQATGCPSGQEMLENAESDDNPYFDPPLEALGERALTVQRSLALMNSGLAREAAESGARLCCSLIGARIGPAHVEFMYLAALARRPAADESKSMLDLIAAAPDRRQGLEDAYWVILNSAEFNTNH